jgi:hypothetical protein
MPVCLYLFLTNNEVILSNKSKCDVMGNANSNMTQIWFLKVNINSAALSATYIHC